jgi:NAD-dependent dihydropyrimidine dehydrogenase PreA subunit
MCEFCHQHGEGRKWYLEAKNYSEDMLSDLKRRRFIERFFTPGRGHGRDERDAARLRKLPAFVRSMVTAGLVRRQKREHFGQVVPIEEVERIFGLVQSVVRVSCYCRHLTTGREHRACYGVSLGPNGGEMAALLRGLDGSFLNGPDAGGIETVSKEDALDAMRGYEREGLCHTVWTFRAPFIGGICNCDRSDCLAMRWSVIHGLPVMFRAETAAAVDPDLCTGCRACLRVCSFGALSYGVADGRVRVDQSRCYGCGVCRAACPKAAIRLLDRKSVPAAAGLWM